ncbi:MAG: TAXI family TRAP transporter solute-binding subunit [Rhodospirillales bacterium]
MARRSVFAFGLTAAVAGATLALPAQADMNDNKPISFSVDGGSATGYFKVVAEAINAIIREVYPGSDATYKPGAPAGGILNIATGKSDIVYTGGPPEIAYAMEGKAPFQASLKGKFLWVAKLHNGLTIHSFATKEWSDKTGVKTYKDLAAKKPAVRLGVNQLATMQSYISGPVAIFKQYGIADKDIEAWGGSFFRSNIATNLEAFRDGKIDAIINGAFVPTATITDIARSREMVWIGGDEAEMKKAAAEWGIDQIVIPKDAYPFLTKDEPTTTVWNVMLAGQHVSDETVYKWLKAVDTHLGRVQSIHPSLKNFDMKLAVTNPTQVAYHPGAEKFYREKGLLK